MEMRGEGRLKKRERRRMKGGMGMRGEGRWKREKKWMKGGKGMRGEGRGKRKGRCVKGGNRKTGG